MHIQWVYSLNRYDQLLKRVDSDRDKVRTLLGDKGTSLAEMRQWGLPVPPAFTITTGASAAYREGNQQIPDGLWQQVSAALADIEHETGKRFGDPTNPLLLSCRVGSRGSRFSMVETVLNIGLNDRITRGLIDNCGDACFVYDLYQRLLHRFGTVVMGVPATSFEAILNAYHLNHDGLSESPLDESLYRQITTDFKSLIAAESGTPFPQNTYDQLHLAIEAAFRAEHNRVGQGAAGATDNPAPAGTAVTVESMVFGNRDNQSATGVARTFHLKTGEIALEGEYLLHAQGEAVEWGESRTKAIADLAVDIPHSWNDLQRYGQQLERYYRAPQEVEFTIEAGKLWLLETRSI